MEVKINKVNIYELNEALVLFKEKGITYIDIIFSEDHNKISLMESSFEDSQGDSKINLEDLI